MTTTELIARLQRRIADFKEATMQLETMTYSKVDAELDDEIIQHLSAVEIERRAGGLRVDPRWLRGENQ